MDPNQVVVDFVGQVQQPGDAGVRVTPPPATVTRDTAIAEAQRLMGQGFSQADAIAAMRRAGWDVK